ncbi:MULTISPECIES: YhgE/Pip domain-containing protein [Clostridium]|uniref:YhgE/Pip domain-containing protein n=1 Tax=Clostridium TaxID=1485 RepID=UPI000824199A|nr:MULTISPECIES: YhgE/Pip domain-containing protein [Clostridium]PJI09513.1 YhgE/Pip domain-containing protein [Clostridium sp. CT7]
MKTVFEIFFRDVRNIRKRLGAVIMIIGLCILPSLYAWINIAACWDPYANTGNIPIAVVNEDQGAILNGKKINVGNQIVSQLKKSKSIKWVFIDEWQGNYGLNDGKYYALLDIPSDFSNGLLSLTTSNPEKPYIIYRNNEKLNAIASKITDAAKNKVAKEVNTNFVNMVTKEALKTIKSNVNTNTGKSNLVALKETLNETTKNLSDTQKYISEANGTSADISKYLSSLQSTLPKVTDKINNLEKAAEGSKSLVSATKNTMNSTSNNLSNDMSSIEAYNSQIQGLLSQLKSVNNSSDTSNMVNTVNELITINNSLDSLLKSDINYLQSINKTNPNNYITSLISSMQAMDAIVQNNANSLNQLKSYIGSGASKDQINNSIDSISALSNELSIDMLSASNNFYSNVMPLINNICNDLNTSLTDVQGLLDSTKVVVPELNALASYASSTCKLSASQASDLSGKLSKLSGDLNGLTTKMNSLSDNDLNDIMKLLSMNNDKLADFISSPLTTKEVDLYNGGVFGVGLTPFYSVLAIWVGVLLCCAVLTTEFKNSKKHEHLNMWQKHFGKMLLFLVLAFIQTTIIILGDMFILNVNPVSIPTLFLFGYVAAIAFTFIIFTLVSIFGNVGKAIAVVMMVFQIAGSGGIYPIQTNPSIFGILEPLWPFTYAINGFREAIAGPIWENVYKNLLALGCFIVFFLFFTLLKKPFHKLTIVMEHKFKESGL